MDPDETSPSSVQTEASAAEPTDAEISLTELARHTAAYVRACWELFASEAALAKSNLVRLLIAALVVPAMAIGVLLGLDGLLAALAYRWSQDWAIALVAVLLLNLAGLLALIMLLRRWWGSLSLPRSRAALSRFMEGLQ
jgi:hypothetical protein